MAKNSKLGESGTTRFDPGIIIGDFEHGIQLLKAAHDQSLMQKVVALGKSLGTLLGLYEGAMMSSPRWHANGGKENEIVAKAKELKQALMYLAGSIISTRPVQDRMVAIMGDKRDSLSENHYQFLKNRYIFFK